MEKEYTKEQFVEDLFEVANVWREDIMLDLAGKTDELWENEIAKKLVRKCAEARRESTEMRKQMLVEAMRGTEEHDEGCADGFAVRGVQQRRQQRARALGRRERALRCSRAGGLERRVPMQRARRIRL